MSKAFGDGRAAAGLPGRRPRRRRRAAARAAAVPPVSSLTQAAARAALAHTDALLATVDAVKAERDRIVAALPRLGLTSVPSDANFVLFGHFADAGKAWQALLDRGVLVRDVGLPGWLRVTAGTADETDAFLTALSEVAPDHRTDSGRIGPHEPHRTGRTRDQRDQVVVEVDLDGTGTSSHQHRRRLLRPHADRAVQARRHRPHRAGRRRPAHRRPPHRGGHRHRARARRSPRRSATRRASAATATRRSRWTRCSCRRRSTSPAGRTSCTPSPTNMTPMIGPDYPTLADPARLRVVRVQRADQPARAASRTPAATPTTSSRRQFKALARALRDRGGARPAGRRRPLHQGRPRDCDDVRPR